MLMLLACSAEERGGLVNTDHYCIVDYRGVALSNCRPVELAEVYLLEGLDNTHGVRRHRIGETDARGSVRGEVALQWGEEARIVENNAGAQLYPLAAERIVTVVYEVDGCSATRKVFDLNEHDVDHTGTIILQDDVEMECESSVSHPPTTTTAAQ
jgi:hypothetical protein